MSGHWDDFRITRSRSKVASWNVTFLRPEKTAEITMRIPKIGIFDDPDLNEELKENQVEPLASKIARILCQELGAPTVPAKAPKPKK